MSKSLKHCLLLFINISIFCSGNLFAQSNKLTSPNELIATNITQDTAGNWVLTVSYHDNTIISKIKLGLMRNDADFSHHLRLKSAGKQLPIHDEYATLHGKKSQVINNANEKTFRFLNTSKQEMDLIVRTYNDGIAFRYRFPEHTSGQFSMTNEHTAYQIPDDDKRWLQKFVRSYEGFYPEQNNNFKTGEWGYPALFQTNSNSANWMLITEADIDRNYCATKLSNNSTPSEYKLTFPSEADGNHIGDVNPSFSLPWQSPWRVVIIGSLSDVVASTLVDDVSKPAAKNDYAWVKPGVASWVYWAYNHGTKDYQRLCQYADLAARMGWQYTLFDWEWNEMGNGGDLEKAVQYALAKGVKPLIWYNSGGKHNTVPAEPRDRLISRENRDKEFTWLKKTGIYGIKVDFFESDKQNIMNYYIDLMEDAARYKLMIYFHGSTVPRGWSRTYPNLMTMEAVAGAEQYNNGLFFTQEAARHNATLPFTRNVIGPMDYTPVTFTNSQHPHVTSFAHELALSVVFESGIQHLADRPEGFDNLPFAEHLFLTRVPAAWDDTRLLSGYPGKSAVIARRKGNNWFIGGINGENRPGQTTIDFSFLPKDRRYRLTLMADGDHNMAFREQYLTVSSTDNLQIKWLPQGGFAAYIEEW